jgi:cold-inducible RNA-binding protein
MEFLTKKVGEAIGFGDDFHVTVVAIKGEDVRIGVTAPKEVAVACEEVHKTRPTMAKKLHVANLTHGVNDSDLEALFAPHGTVESAQVVMDPATGLSKGSGFVEMATCQQAQAAMAALNGNDSNGKTLAVNEARPPLDPVVIVAAVEAGPLNQ